MIVRRWFLESVIWLMLLALSLPVDKASLTVAWSHVPAGTTQSHPRPMLSIPYQTANSQNNWQLPNLSNLLTQFDSGRVSPPTLPTASLAILWITLPLWHVLSSAIRNPYSAPIAHLVPPLEKPPVLFA